MKMNQDCLSRQPYLDLLKSIIEKQKDNSSGYSFAIDGDWGSGKTWILNSLENMLLSEKDNEYLIFHYNAWENDFYEEPLVALLSVMIEKLNNANIDSIREEIGLDKYTFDDIIEDFKKPNRDPRDEAPKVVLKSDVLTIDDVTIGMELTGTVRNVVDFGLFIDIGLHNDGLAHISHLSKNFVKHPSDLFQVGDIVTCYVIDIDKKNEKVSLSLLKEDKNG